MNSFELLILRYLVDIEDSIRENLEELPQDFTLSTITFEQIIIIGQLIKSLYDQVDDRTVFEVVDNALEREEWFEANQTESKEIKIERNIMITKDELEELIRNQGLAPYVYIKDEKEQFKNQIGETCSIYHVA